MTDLLKCLAACALLSGLAACASAPPPATAPESGYRHYVVERDVVVRRTASAGADAVGRLSAGTTVKAEIVEVGDGWFRLHSDSGRTGYIFGRPLQPAE